MSSRLAWAALVGPSLNRDSSPKESLSPPAELRKHDPPSLYPHPALPLPPFPSLPVPSTRSHNQTQTLKMTDSTSHFPSSYFTSTEYNGLEKVLSTW